MRQSQRVTGLSALLMIAIATAGCGAEQAPEVATIGGTPTAAATGDVLTSYIEGVRGYVTCLRAEGVKVSDPDPKGRIEFEGDLKLLKSDPSWVAAQEKCRSLLPPAPAGLDDKPVKTAEQIETARQYARCMREKGAPDFPDPGPDGYFADRSSSGGWDQTTAGARQATLACASIIGDPTSGPGQG